LHHQPRHLCPQFIKVKPKFCGFLVAENAVFSLRVGSFCVLDNHRLSFTMRGGLRAVRGPHALSERGALFLNFKSALDNHHKFR
jgi:hypothetical protein